MIREFYAVTMTSVYHVTDTGRNGDSPSAKKIALKGESSLPVGYRLENGGGRLIAICSGLLAFIPEAHGLLSPMTGYEREPAQVDTRWHEGNTSPIVALFETNEEAIGCFESEDLGQADPRWLESTKRVLEKIGDNHPAFVISHWHGDCLLPEQAIGA